MSSEGPYPNPFAQKKSKARDKKKKKPVTEPTDHEDKARRAEKELFRSLYDDNKSPQLESPVGMQQLTRVRIDQQDEVLEDMSTVLGRLTSMGEQIGHELDAHNQYLW
jgi:hypothetical protein